MNRAARWLLLAMWIGTGAAGAALILFSVLETAFDRSVVAAISGMITLGIFVVMSHLVIDDPMVLHRHDPSPDLHDYFIRNIIGCSRGCGMVSSADPRVRLQVHREGSLPPYIEYLTPPWPKRWLYPKWVKR